MKRPSQLARLEKWSHGHKARSVVVSSPDGYGAGCWSVSLGHENGVTVAEEANFWMLPEEKGGERAYIAEAERQGIVFAGRPDDVDWAGLEATIRAALDAFDRGVWGPRTARHAIADAQLIREAVALVRAQGRREGIAEAIRAFPTAMTGDLHAVMSRILCLR